MIKTLNYYETEANPMEESARKIYSEVVKKFPNINEGDVNIEYSPDYLYTVILILDYYEFIALGKFVKKPILGIGSNFLELDKEEKKAAIAHELGHYEHDTKGKLEGLKRRTLWNIAYNFHKEPEKLALLSKFKSESVKQILSFLQKERKIAKLRKWYHMCELDADNKAIEAGYGKPLLNVLRKIYDKECLGIIRPNNLLDRINNLEYRLKQAEEY